MIAELDRLEITPTIPITASTLERHPELKSEIRAVDLAIHGYRHVPYAGLTADDQTNDLEAAVGVFASSGLTVRGFRAPYLSSNESTREILRAKGFSYDSSTATFALPDDLEVSPDARSLTTERYGILPSGPVFPALDKGLVELPVSLPDDEILVDGLGLTNSETISRVLVRMLESAYDENSLMVLQIHPERFPLFSEAVTRVGRAASAWGAHRGSLSDIAEQARSCSSGPSVSFTLAVTGDLDAATLGDFASRLRWG